MVGLVVNTEVEVIKQKRQLFHLCVQWPFFSFYSQTRVLVATSVRLIMPLVASSLRLGLVVKCSNLIPKLALQLVKVKFMPNSNVVANIKITLVSENRMLA